MEEDIMYLVYTTIDSEEKAHDIARTLIQEHLAACVHVAGLGKSFYEWQGVLETTPEYVLWIKTRAGLREALQERLRTLHSYEVPCILAWPCDNVPEPFMDWVRNQTA